MGRFLTGIPRLDGRWLTAGCVLIYFAGLFAAHPFMDYRRAWARLQVPAMAPAFLDLRGLISGAESLREGVDPILNNPHDPLHRPANYPHLWFYPFLALHVHESSAVALGVALALAFYGSLALLAGRLGAWEGLAWGAALCAPTTMLAVERGNNDLMIVTLLALALVARRTSAAGTYALIEGSAMLKLYPLGTFCVALRERRRAALVALAAGACVFAAYLYTIRDELRAIRQTLPHPYVYAFGRGVLADWYNAEHGGSVPAFVPLLAAGTLVVAAIGLWRYAPALPAMPEIKVGSLMVGSVLYASAFALNNNFHYRMILLLFSLPALLHLVRLPGFTVGQPWGCWRRWR